MSCFFQSTSFGQLVRLLSRNRFLKYPDEADPSLWRKACKQDAATSTGTPEKIDIGNEPNALVVGWYGSDDPENPQNWPNRWKHLLMAQICLLNFAVYLASSIYTPGEPYLMEEFNVSEVVAILGLSLFTLGYGVGPMLWSPLSEMPQLGRTGIFVGTLFGFVIFQLPVGFAPNIAVFLVFRWVTGFCGSPCLSTGGGTITDMYSPTQVPYFLCVWSWSGVLSPLVGPLIGGYIVPAEGWRWTIWLFTILCSFVFILMFFLFPETSASTILYQRAKRLRKATGNSKLRSQTEIDSAHYTPRDTMILLARAFTLTFTEPIVFLMDLYAGLLYGILFLWFESFPIVFGDIYGFSPGESGLAFLGILVFTILTAPLYLLWLNKSLIPRIKSGTGFTPEMVLPPTFIGAVALPICLFWFAWVSRESVHWIVPIIGSGVFAVAIVTLFNSVYMYIGIIYARYAASVFAGAALFRASMGAAFPLFANALFSRLGVGPGNSLLGGIAVAFIPVPVIFYLYGARIRQWSKHAG
ncbi:MFS transporter [Aspergillus stella-maris]|uniref:MFS transporter n=1 Tax=Aspergillus stella-maris TaxID=1810926 RepID=UPI003CCE2673